MAKVPVIQEQSIGIDPLPRAYQSPSIPGGTFGELEANALAQAGQTVAGVGKDIMRREKERDANYVLDIMTSAEDEMRPFLNDKKTGIKFQLGKNALGAGEKTKAQLDTVKKRYEKQLSSPRQKAAFSSLWDKYSGSVLNRVGEHEGRQFRVYQDENTASVVKGAIEDVMNDPDRQDVIDGAMLRAETVISANHHGQGALTVDDKISDVKSQIHAAAVMSLSDTNAAAASEYYKQHKTDIKPQFREKIEKVLSASNLKQTAQSLSDNITDEGGELSEQLKKARDISKKKTVNGVDSAELRDEVERRVKLKFQWEEKMRAERKKAAEDTTWRTIDDGLDAGADVNALLKAADKIDDPGTRHQMVDYIQKKIAGVDVISDMSRYIEINDMIDSDPEKLKAFMALDLNKERSVLSRSHIAHFSDIQKNLRAGGTKGKDQLSSVKTVRTFLNDNYLKGIYGGAGTDEARLEYIRQIESFDKWIKNNPEKDPSEYQEKISSVNVLNWFEKLVGRGGAEVTPQQVREKIAKEGSTRQKAIEILRQKKYPITEKNIKYVMDQLNAGN